MSLLISIVVFLLVLFYLLFKPNKYDAKAQFQVENIAHSISEYGAELLTIYAKYPRFIHAEMMTHKDFSRSASSSRAIPVKKMLSQVWNNPATPIHWGANMPGMQAKDQLTGWRRTVAMNIWALAGKTMCLFCWFMMKVGLHKQVANRLLEPWQMIHVVITSAHWKNFYKLRIHQDAQPEINYLATLIYHHHRSSEPDLLLPGQWHLPWIREEDYINAKCYVHDLFGVDDAPEADVIDLLKKQSAARCARTSYATFDGKPSTIAADLELYQRLIGSTPVHASPAEHQATPDICDYRYKEKCEWRNPHLHGNLIGWCQHRRMIPDHYTEG